MRSIAMTSSHLRRIVVLGLVVAPLQSTTVYTPRMSHRATLPGPPSGRRTRGGLVGVADALITYIKHTRGDRLERHRRPAPVSWRNGPGPSRGWRPSRPL